MGTVEATFSTVYEIVTANGGGYDGWGGTIAVAQWGLSTGLEPMRVSRGVPQIWGEPGTP